MFTLQGARDEIGALLSAFITSTDDSGTFLVLIYFVDNMVPLMITDAGNVKRAAFVIGCSEESE
jgi:hypothetical protein